ncbi:MAG: wax ester/triacylglycerol synthase domain-containing protein [Thermodesulfobacteriota bacterium]
MLRGAPCHPDVVDALSRAIDRHPRLRRRRVKRRGRLSADWVEQGFDLSYHLRWERLGNDRDLLGTATQRFFQPLARQAPPWEVHVLEGDARSLVLVKLAPTLERAGLCGGLLASLLDEHDETEEASGEASNPMLALVESLDALVPRAAALRQSALGLLRTARETALLSGELARATLGATRRDAGAWSAELAAAALRAARSLGALVTERLAESAPGALLGSVSTPRALALVDLPLAALDAVRRPLGLALEDVLLSISSGALARLEQDQHGVLPANLRALVSLPESRVAGMLLPIEEKDPLRRAAHFHDLLAALGGEARLAAMKALAGAMTALPLALSQGIAPRTAPRYDVELAYRELPLRARTLAGARVQRIYPLTAGGGATGLAVGAQRFDRWLSLGVSFDSSVVGRPRGLVDAWQAACGEFLDAAIVATAQRVDSRLRARSC